MKNQNYQLLNILLPNLKNPEAIKKNIKLDFNEIKKKIIEKSKESVAAIATKKKPQTNKKNFSKAELKSIFAKNSLLVAVRVRKLNKKEISDFSAQETIKKIDKDTLVITEPIDAIFSDLNSNSEKEKNSQNSISTLIKQQQKIKENYFSFDFIFDKEATQEEIYLNTSKLLLEEVLEGYNATVFAYGATGSGKTYTMVGNGENPGIMVRAVSDLFSLIEQKKSKKVSIKVLYVEVYNENIRDLISGKNDLEVREDPKMGMQIVGASEEQVINAEDVFKLLMYFKRIFIIQFFN